MIISFSGRKSSGKTTLANYLISKGFKKISFATELKRLVSQLYNINIEDLSDTIKKENILNEPLEWNKSKAIQLAELINASRELDSKTKLFFTTREALQYIGTEILRNYDNDFHVKSIQKYINSEENYVLDDVRFCNELSLLKNMGAICIYILRPYFFGGYSNHTSEIQLNRKDFNYVIVNSRDESFLLKQFCRFEKLLLRKTDKMPSIGISRDELIQRLKTKSTSEIASSLGCSRDCIAWWCNRYLIPIIRNAYGLDHDVFLDANRYSAYWAGLLSADGCLKAARLNHKNRHNYVLELASNDYELIGGFQRFLKTDKPPYKKKSTINGKISYLLTINSPFIVDDMKLWNIEPRKSKYNKVPDCIRDNDILFKYWLVGLIDGDGSIYINKPKGNIRLNILASKEIIDYVRQKYFHINGAVSQVKDVNNLFSLVYSGKAVVQFYREIYRGMGLKRKWTKITPFLNKKWYY